MQTPAFWGIQHLKEQDLKCAERLLWLLPYSEVFLKLAYLLSHKLKIFSIFCLADLSFHRIFILWKMNLVLTRTWSLILTFQPYVLYWSLSKYDVAEFWKKLYKEELRQEIKFTCRLWVSIGWKNGVAVRKLK